MPTTATIAWLGKSYQAIKALERLGLLDGTASRRAYRRLIIKASDEGVGVSRVDANGKPLHAAIRLHWMGSGGYSRHRIYRDSE